PVGAAMVPALRPAGRPARRQPGAHRDDQRRLEMLDAAEHLESLVLPVHRGQPVEVATAELVGGEAGEFLPAIARQGNGEPTVGYRVHSELRLDTRARVGGRHAP